MHWSYIFLALTQRYDGLLPVQSQASTQTNADLQSIGLSAT